jgi:serine/threonine protein kinase
MVTDVVVIVADLSSANVLLEAKDTSSWSDDDVYEYFGEPYMAPVHVVSDKRAKKHAPRCMVANICYETFEAEHFTGNVVVADFGISFFTRVSAGRESPPLSPPAALLGVKWEYGAPELLFGFPPSYASDVWALACVLFEIVGGRGMLFGGFVPDVRYIMTLVSSTLGAFPTAWLAPDIWQVDLERLLAHKLHDKDWWKRKWWRTNLPSRPLDLVVAERVTQRSDGAQAALLDVLRAALVYEPEKRVSAAEIATHWLWRQMAIEGDVDEVSGRSIVY